jgi:hypothetical protein
MKRQLKTIVLISAILFSSPLWAQDDDVKEENPIQTVFRGGSHSIGGYGALTNKLTTIRGRTANLAGIYGGVYINHKFFLGVGASGLTNTIKVPLEFSTDPTRDMSYEYGQVGLVTEYVLGSNKAFHLAFNLFSGGGFTVQHEDYDWKDHHDDEFDFEEDSHDTNWFFVAEPGVQLEINVFKWMRFSPGVSYRAAFGSDGLGMKDSDISNISYNATLKFGVF